MDLVEVPVEELGYQVLTLKTNVSGQLLLDESPKLRAQIANSDLVYGAGYGSAPIARALHVPYIAVLEYDLQTQLVVATSQVASWLRKGVRAGRCALNFFTSSIAEMRGAHSLHCNGYPTYDQSRALNPNRLLYLDSRMSSDLVISENTIAERLAARRQRPLRLLFTGRYEPMKGALHAVRVGLECVARNLDVEMHCYGQGSLLSSMRRLAAESGRGRVHVHEAIPYPELVRLSRTFDLFVCCHIQSDPSCTYLESFGAGLPVVGYGNRMWRRLCDESRAGCWSRVGALQDVVSDVEILARDDRRLATLSQRARAFAVARCFENEFKLRTDAINAALRAPTAARDGRR
jgi:glycosyltransferase involved in cell wall biosynthesis